MKVVKIILLSLLSVVALAAIGGWLWFRSTAPDYSGTLQLEGLKEPVEVRFDDYGVPHIKAGNPADAYMALGFVHAQDRLFQMEMLRRLAGGRLAEILGKDLVKVDKLFRTLGLNQVAEKNATAMLSADTTAYQQAAHAYLRGVNAFISTGKKPIEFSLIGIPLTPFTDKDMFLVAGYMAFSFAEAMRVDPVFQQLHETYPGYLEEAFGTTAEAAAKANRSKSWKGKTAGELSAVLHDALEKIPVPLLVGSNGWVIAGSRTASGKPILANDTHIGYAQPAVWYEAQIEYPGFSFYGHHIAGIPFGVLGNNDQCAWGITMFENDDMDFYQEKLNPENPSEIIGCNDPARKCLSKIESRMEEILVKDSAPVMLEVRRTIHGPVINGLVEGVDSARAPVSLWWSMLERPATLLKSFYDLNHAKGLEDAQQAVAGIAAPGLNIVYADTAGNIAWWAAAAIPVRNKEDQAVSRLFYQGDSEADLRMNYYPFEKNPQAVNPPWGYVHTGNNQPDSVDGILYPGYYYPVDRAGRIEQLLKEKSDWTPETVSAMQLDHVSITAPANAKEIASVIGPGPLADVLNEWDGAHGLDDAGPAVYYNLLAHIIWFGMGDEIGADGLRGLLMTSVMKEDYPQILKNDSTKWWDDVRTTERESRTDIFNKAAARALVVLERECGKGRDQWKWGKIHQLKHPHPLGSVELLDGLFSVGPYPVTGGNEVINNLMFDLDTTGVFQVKGGPALRKVHDLSDLSTGKTISPSGQSGVLSSRHYSDQAEQFATGKVRDMTMRFTAGTLLRLEPK
ncbi:MAG: penicillin acylase family protein [Bacteroidota bacterium]